MTVKRTRGTMLSAQFDAIPPALLSHFGWVLILGDIRQCIMPPSDFTPASERPGCCRSLYGISYEAESSQQSTCRVLLEVRQGPEKIWGSFPRSKLPYVSTRPIKHKPTAWATAGRCGIIDIPLNLLSEHTTIRTGVQVQYQPFSLPKVINRLARMCFPRKSPRSSTNQSKDRRRVQSKDPAEAGPSAGVQPRPGPAPLAECSSEVLGGPASKAKAGHCNER